MLFDLDSSAARPGFRSGVSAPAFSMRCRERFRPARQQWSVEIEESWTTPVDTRLHKLGGIVFRRLRSEVVEDQLMRAERKPCRESAAFEADLKTLQDDLRHADAENRAAIQKNIRAGQDADQGHAKPGEKEARSGQGGNGRQDRVAARPGKRGE